MTDKRDRPEHWWETWLRKRRIRRCPGHDFAPWAVMRFTTESFLDPTIHHEEWWTMCRNCPAWLIRWFDDGVEAH